MPSFQRHHQEVMCSNPENIYSLYYLLLFCVSQPIPPFCAVDSFLLGLHKVHFTIFQVIMSPHGSASGCFSEKRHQFSKWRCQIKLYSEFLNSLITLETPTCCETRSQNRADILSAFPDWVSKRSGKTEEALKMSHSVSKLQHAWNPPGSTSEWLKCRCWQKLLRDCSPLRFPSQNCRCPRVCRSGSVRRLQQRRGYTCSGWTGLRCAKHITAFPCRGGAYCSWKLLNKYKTESRSTVKLCVCSPADHCWTRFFLTCILYFLLSEKKTPIERRLNVNIWRSFLNLYHRLHFSGSDFAKNSWGRCFFLLIIALNWHVVSLYSVQPYVVVTLTSSQWKVAILFLFCPP